MQIIARDIGGRRGRREVVWSTEDLGGGMDDID